jgi:hypothetical protein
LFLSALIGVVVDLVFQLPAAPALSLKLCLQALGQSKGSSSSVAESHLSVHPAFLLLQ